MVISQLLCPDNAVQVGLHELLNDYDADAQPSGEKGSSSLLTVDLLELLLRRRLDNVQDRDDLPRHVRLQNNKHPTARMRTFSFTQVSEKNFNSLSSRSVRRQKSVCSKGRTFLIATSFPDGLCSAAATVPYAPSPSPCRMT